MHRLVAIICAILFYVPATFSQEASNTVQVGYAVVTPSFPLSGMFVFANVIQTRSAETLEASLVPSKLVTSALLPVDLSRNLSPDLGIAITNPNNSFASITLTLTKSDGTQVTSTTLAAPTRGQISKFVTELFPPPAPGSFSTQVPIPSEFTGTLRLTSTMPISLLGLRFRESAYSVLPLIDLSQSNNPVPVILSGVGGLGAVLLPQFVTGSGWATEIEIVNITASDLTVRLDVFSPNGTPLTVKLNGISASSFTNLIVPANGLLKIAP